MLAFFRRHEKLMFWIFVIPALLGFGMVAPVENFFMDRQDPVLARVWDVPMRSMDLAAAQEEIRVFTAFSGGDLNRNITDDEAWEYLILRQTAEQAGVTVTPQEVLRDIQEKYREFQATIDVLSNPQIRQQDRQREIQRRKALIVLNRLDDPNYLNLLKRFGLERRTLERATEGHLKVEGLKTLVTSTAFVPTEELLKTFRERHERRALEYVSLAAKDYADTSSKISADTVAAHYERRKADFWLDERIAFRGLAVMRQSYLDRQPAASEADVEAYYQKNKDLYYRERLTPSETLYYPLNDERKEEIRKKIASEKLPEFFQAEFNRLKAMADTLSFDRMKALVPGNSFGYGDTVSVKVLREKSPFSLFDGVTAQLESLKVGTKTLLTYQDPTGKLGGFLLLEKLDLIAARQRELAEVAFEIKADLLGASLAELESSFEDDRASYFKPSLYQVEFVSATYDSTRVPEATREELESKFKADPKAFAAPGDTTTPQLSDPAVLARVKDAVRRDLAKKSAENKIRKIAEALSGENPSTLEILAAEWGVQYAKTEYVDQKTLSSNPLIANDRYFSLLLTRERGSVSEAYENESQTGWALARLVGSRQGGLPTFNEVREEVLEKWLQAQGVDKIVEQSKDLLKALRKGGLGAAYPHTAGKTSLFGRQDEIPELGRQSGLAREAFELELGQAWSGPYEDREAERVIFFRLAEIAKPADQDFLAAEEQIRGSSRRTYEQKAWQRYVVEQVTRWRGLDVDAVEKVTDIRYPVGGKKRDIRVITVSPDAPLALATELRERLLRDPSDANWDSLARNYSDERYKFDSARNKGVVKGNWRSHFGESLAEAVKILPVGQLSEPIFSEDHYYLVQKIGEAESREGAELQVRHILYRYDETGESNWGDATTKEARRAKALAQAQAAIAAIRSGAATFQELVDKDSDDPGKTSNDGLYTIQWRDPNYQAAFVATAETLAVGAVSAPVEVDSNYQGFHVLTLEAADLLPRIRVIAIGAEKAVDTKDPAVAAQLAKRLQADADSIAWRLSNGETLDEIGQDYDADHRRVKVLDQDHLSSLFRNMMERPADMPQDPVGQRRWIEDRFGQISLTETSEFENLVWQIPLGQISEVLPTHGGHQLLYTVSQSDDFEEVTRLTVYRMFFGGTNSERQAKSARQAFLDATAELDEYDNSLKSAHFMLLASQAADPVTRKTKGCFGVFAKSGRLDYYGAECAEKLKAAKPFEVFRAKQGDKLHFVEVIKIEDLERQDSFDKSFQDLRDLIPFAPIEFLVMTRS